MKTQKLILILTAFTAVFFQSCMSDMSSDLQKNADDIECLQTKSLSLQEQDYSPIGVIPDWAIKEMSKEELEMWRTIVSVYHVDFSFLQDDISISAKEELNETLKLMIEDINKNKIKEEVDYYFSVQKTLKSNFPEKLTKSEQSDITSIYGPVTLYSSRNSLSRVAGTFTYKTNKDRTAVISASDAHAYASGYNSRFEGSSSVYVNGKYAVTFNCAGTLFINSISEDFNVSHVYKIIL